MKYTIEEIKTMLKGITPGEWEVRQQIPYSQALLVFAGRFENNRTICRGEWTTRQGDNDLKFIAAAPTIIRDLLAEVEKLNIENAKLAEQINYYHLAFRGRHELSLAAWAQKTIHELQAENERLTALAATHLADQELLVGRERKRVARECAEMCEPWGVADRIRTRYGVEE